MKRAIRFRAWDISNKRMFENVQLSNFDAFLRSSRRENENDFVVTQFTGVKDSEGSDVYEGDIVERSEHNDICDIVYREDWGAFAFHGRTKIGDGFSRLYSGHSVFPWKVIGNIFEQELLGKELHNPDIVGFKRTDKGKIEVTHSPRLKKIK